MSVRRLTPLSVLLSLAATANASFVTNTYHLEGSFNSDGGGFTETTITKPNSSALESYIVDYQSFVESHLIPLTITIPEAPAWAETFASGIFVSGTISWSELSMTVEPVASDCGGFPCPYSGVATIGHSQQIWVSNPVNGGYNTDSLVWLGADLAGKSFDIDVTLWVPTVERVTYGYNAKTIFKMWGPTSFSIDVLASTEYLGTPEPSTAAMVVACAIGLLAGWAAGNHRWKSMNRRPLARNVQKKRHESKSDAETRT